MKEYTKDVPTQEPVCGPTVTYNRKSLAISDYDWEEFLKMDREKQVEALEFLLGGLRELPRSLEMAKRNSPRDTGIK